MKTFKYAAPSLAAATLGVAVAFAPIASAATHATPAPTQSPHAAVTDTDPATPYGTDPESPAIFGYHTWLGDDTDVPF
ncbi:hypothetical protein A5724_17490 [Mycobacterium sp. ACS1612]|uniref:hypothetical protein n=1 Tax=Mycobacterium sp. ACS1612 TaxID=1834117 RepID=UPI0008025321|nr:hypothetical protein [Mycobacterium sp. ACS1612]OBF34019.1 hypothetical protein A5724_17490 [Mycobacterium sp. ACS1612]